MSTITEWLAFLGWGKAHLIALGFGAALSTVLAWTFKYPLRLYTERNGYPLPAFKWAVRCIAGAGAFIGTQLSWPDRGRLSVLAGFLAWAAVLIVYRFSAPIAAKWFPWISSDHIVKDDEDD